MQSPRPPDDSYLDTSVIVATTFSGLPNGSASAAFCDSLVGHRKPVSYSQIVWLELSRRWYVRDPGKERRLVPGPTAATVLREHARLPRRAREFSSTYLAQSLRNLASRPGQLPSETRAHFQLD